MSFHDFNDFTFGAVPKHPFLSAPPPPKMRLAQRPTARPPSCPLPPTPTKVRRRTSFAAAIANWASHVQPGTPAPTSPQGCLSSCGRGPSPTCTTNFSPKSACHKTFDFTAIGYNSFFVHVPKAPDSPSPPLRAHAEKGIHRNEGPSLQKAQAEETQRPPHDQDECILVFDPLGAPPNATVKPGPMLLSIPARPFRAAKHLRNPRFMFDVQEFAHAMQENTAGSQIRFPRSPFFSHALKGNAVQAPDSPMLRTRRRPAPLKISPAMQKMRMVVAVSSPGSGVPPLSTRVANFSYAKYPPSNIPTTVVSPLASMTRLLCDGKLQFVANHCQPEVSIFEDDSECDFVR